MLKLLRKNKQSYFDKHKKLMMFFVKQDNLSENT